MTHDPIKKLMDDYAIVRKALADLVGADTKEELEAMRQALWVNPQVPDPERLNMSNACTALLETLHARPD